MDRLSENEIKWSFIVIFVIGKSAEPLNNINLTTEIKKM